MTTAPRRQTDLVNVNLTASHPILPRVYLLLLGICFLLLLRLPDSHREHRQLPTAAARSSAASIVLHKTQIYGFAFGHGFLAGCYRCCGGHGRPRQHAAARGHFGHLWQHQHGSLDLSYGKILFSLLFCVSSVLPLPRVVADTVSSFRKCLPTTRPRAPTASA